MNGAGSLTRRGRWSSRVLLAFAGLAVLARAQGSAFAATTPACDQAVKRFDTEFQGRHDDQALAAARALAAPCSGKDVARALAESVQGIVYYQRHDLAAAAGAFVKAIRLSPQDPTLRMSLCGVYTDARRFQEAIATCMDGLKLAREQDDGTVKKHDKVLELGFNLSLAKIRRGPSCDDHSVLEMFDAYRAAHPEHAWVYQVLGAWAWDCDDDFDRGLALYKKSCSLGHQPACEQVAYTESCMCETRIADHR
jgi:tetratricopeptide (TPR) repeat protein